MPDPLPQCCASSGLEAVYLIADGYQPGGPCPRCGAKRVPFSDGRLAYHYPPEGVSPNAAPSAAVAAEPPEEAGDGR